MPPSLPSIVCAGCAHFAQHRACWMCPLCSASWVLCATDLHSSTGGFMPTSTSTPQASWPRSSPQHSPYLSRHSLQTGRHWLPLRQPQTHHSSAAKPSPGKSKKYPCSVLCITLSAVVFHLCLLGGIFHIPITLSAGSAHRAGEVTPPR